VRARIVAVGSCGGGWPSNARGGSRSQRRCWWQVAREFGCGDKWGLFSTYLPHRVGYQCSAYYRQVILPEGLVIDPNYLFTRSGYAVYNGSHMRGRRE